jgi:hypothetical protein
LAWFKVDDGFYSSRKVLSIPRSIRLECIGLWVMAGAWSAKELTDGEVPDYVLDEFGGTPEAIKSLLGVGLWKSHKNGVIFHDWNEYNPSKEEVVERRKKVSEVRSKAGKNGALTRWQNDGKAMAKKVLPSSSKTFAIDSDPEDVDHCCPPDGKIAKPWQKNGKAMAPTRPNPTHKQAKACLLPKNWKPNTAAEDFAKANGLDCAFEAEQFKNHAEATQRTMKNWDAAFRVWLGNAVKWKKPGAKSTAEDDWMNR